MNIEIEAKTMMYIAKMIFFFPGESFSKFRLRKAAILFCFCRHFITNLCANRSLSKDSRSAAFFNLSMFLSFFNFDVFIFKCGPPFN